MARIRTLKPEILSDERTAALSDGAFRLFISMITLADDHGNVRASIPWLTGQVWWARGDSPRVAEYIAELAAANLIEVYTVRNQAYSHLNGWKKHQRIDNAGKPQVPTPSEADVQVAEPRREPPRLAAGPGPGRDQDQEEDQEGEVAEAPARPRDLKIAGVAVVKQSTPARKSTSRSASVALPADWEPRAAEVEMATSLGVDAHVEAEKMRDWAASKGPEANKADWNAAFRNWLRRASGTQQTHGRKPGASIGPAAPRSDHPDGTFVNFGDAT